MSIFRELFVEVPTALLEAAVREAQDRNLNKTALHRSRTSLFVDAVNDTRGRILCERYGWATVTVFRVAWEESMEFHITMPCGHRHRMRLVDMVIEDSTPVGAIRLLDRQWDGVTRCYCVRRSLP